MRVVALTPYPEPAPSTRFRVAQFREPLVRAGVDLQILPFLAPEEYGYLYGPGSGARKARILVRALKRRLGHIEESRRADLILIHREIAPAYPSLFLQRLRAVGVPAVFDFDDAIFLPAKGGNPILQRLRRPRSSTIALCRWAGLVLAGNEYLADFAREARGGTEGVEVVPTVLDTRRYCPAPREEMKGGARCGGDAPVIGWIGTHTTLTYLEAISPALVEASDQCPFRLLVVCNREPRIDRRIAVEFREWSQAREVEDLHSMDAGVYPLPDDPWTLGKCGFKAIQYMACGLPVVASPVGVLRQMVWHGETGFHATSADEWVRGIARLLQGPSLRTEMGRLGRERAETSYSVASILPRLISLLETAKR